MLKRFIYKKLSLCIKILLKQFKYNDKFININHIKH